MNVHNVKGLLCLAWTALVAHPAAAKCGGADVDVDAVIALASAI